MEFKTYQEKAEELSALEMKRLRHPGHGYCATFAASGVDGLLIKITPTGGTVLAVAVHGREKRRHIELGGYPDVLLAQARERARAAHDLICQGIDPIERKRAARAALAATQRPGLSFERALEFMAATWAQFGPKSIWMRGVLTASL